MALNFARLPNLQRARRLEEVIHSLEGWTFGRWLQFASLGYGDQLHISLGGWTEIKQFKEVPGLREFAEDLNIAMKPAIERYVAFLREEMAKELLKVADKARDVDGGKPPSDRPNMPLDFETATSARPLGR